MLYNLIQLSEILQQSKGKQCEGYRYHLTLKDSIFAFSTFLQLAWLAQALEVYWAYTSRRGIRWSRLYRILSYFRYILMLFVFCTGWRLHSQRGLWGNLFQVAQFITQFLFIMYYEDLVRTNAHFKCYKNLRVWKKEDF